MTLHGRHDSLRFLAEAASAAKVGQGALIMVRADPGIGVTSLLDEHLSATRGSGLRAHRIPVLPPDGRTTLSAGAPEWDEPALVVIDDLHRADDETLLMLHGLAEEIYGRPLLVVTGRHRGVAPDRFAGLDRLAIVHDLGPLDTGAVNAMGADSSQVGEAGGNPWLLSRITAADRAAQVASWATGLAGPDIDLLRSAALLGESASVDELAAVIGSTPGEVLSAVARLSARGLADEAAGEVRLRYPLLRNDIAATSAGLRSSVARTLAGLGVPVERVAEQLAHVPVDDWTVNWLAEHAEPLATRSSPAVVRLLEAAVAALRPGDSRMPPLRAAWVEALLWSGRAEQARQAASEDLLAELDASIRHRLLAVLGIIANGEFNPGPALAVLEPERRDGEVPARLTALAAYAHLLAGDLEAAERAVAEAARANDPLVEIYLCNIRAIGLCLLRNYSAAGEQLDRAAALLEIAAHDPAQWLLSRLLRAVVQNLDDDPAVLDAIEQARPVACEIGLGFLPWLHTIAAVAALKLGEWDRALTEVEDGLALPHQYGMAGPLHAVAATILLNRGDLTAARTHAELAEQAVPHGVAMFYQSLMTVTRALLAAVDGDLQRAVQIVRDVVERDAGMPHDRSIAPVCVPLVRIAVAGGDRELARRIIERMEEWNRDDDSAINYCRGLVDDDVDRLLAAAQDFADNSTPLAAAQAAQDAAVALAASGRSEAAKEAYRSAIDRYAAMAAHREIDRTTANLRSFGVRLGATGSRGRPKHGWESLTGAEMRVAELVAQGLTNRDVAERLIVSVRTVDSHVSRILRKLGCSSRLELAVRYRDRS